MLLRNATKIHTGVTNFILAHFPNSWKYKSDKNRIMDWFIYSINNVAQSVIGGSSRINVENCKINLNIWMKAKQRHKIYEYFDDPLFGFEFSVPYN